MISRKTLHFARLTVSVLFWPGLAILITGSLIALDFLPFRIEVHHRDLVLHFLGYCTLAAMAACGLHRRQSAILAALGLILLGGALEILQAYTGRDRSLYDALANAAGASFGCILGRALVEPLYRRYGSSADQGEGEG